MSLLQNVPDRTQGDETAPAGRPARRARGTSGEPPNRPANGESNGGGSLTRVTANFTPRAMASLERIATETGDSKTDILNRSVMVYEVFLQLLERSGGVLQLRYPDGKEESLRLLG